MSASKVVFLDRDGTINVDHGYVSKISDWKFTDKAAQGLKKLKEDGYLLAVVTNQSGIGRGYYTLEDLQAVHRHMQDELKKVGVTIDAIAYCADDPDANCNCRKPATGMAKHIERELGEIDYAHSWMIGDKEADFKFGKALGMKTALIRSDYWKEDVLETQPDVVVDSLFEAAAAVTK